MLIGESFILRYIFSSQFISNYSASKSKKNTVSVNIVSERKNIGITAGDGFKLLVRKSFQFFWLMINNYNLINENNCNQCSISGVFDSTANQVNWNIK